jgi:hypothetical protein
MIRPGVTAGAWLLTAALVAGTWSDARREPPARVIGGYHVLAADFHVHSFPFTWSSLAPWDTALEAHYQGLDVIAMTPHHMACAGRVGRWASQLFGGPLVLVGEEITGPGYHVLAIGIDRAIRPSVPLAGVLDEIHAQGGVAIAAHPYRDFWPTYTDDVMRKLDGSEVVRPEAQHAEPLAADLRGFFARAPLAAIGNSDYHGLGPVGYSRTYVFATSRTEEAVVEAVRAKRTVVYDRSRAYGDPAMIALAAESGGLPNELPRLPPPGALARFSRIAAVLGMLLALFFNTWRN